MNKQEFSASSWRSNQDYLRYHPTVDMRIKKYMLIQKGFAYIIIRHIQTVHTLQKSRVEASRALESGGGVAHR